MGLHFVIKHKLPYTPLVFLSLFLELHNFPFFYIYLKGENSSENAFKSTDFSHIWTKLRKLHFGHHSNGVTPHQQHRQPAAIELK